MTRSERIQVAILALLVAVAAVLLVTFWRSENRESVPEAVLKDHMTQGTRYSDVTGTAGETTWTTESVARAEFDLIEKNIGLKRPPFTLHIRFLLGHQGMVTYKTVNGKLVLDMCLRPVYHSKAAAQATAGHELGHVYAIWYAQDYTEETAWTLAACHGSPESREWIKTVVGTEPTENVCNNLRDKLMAP